MRLRTCSVQRSDRVYGLDKETCTELIRKAFAEGCLDLTAYEDCEWLYPEEDE